MKTNESILNLDKETGNKWRWNGDVNGVSFKLYIPNNVVPDPVPQRIGVVIIEGAESGHNNFPSRDSIGLRVLLEYKSDHIETKRYQPTGDSAEFIGEPYIPSSMLSTPNPRRIGLIVRWI